MSKKGRTRKPCHGCGEERGWRTQGEVCVSCKRLMADGRRYREETAEDPTLGLYRYSLDRLHWNEPIGVTSIPRGWGGDGPRRRLERAFHELVLLLVKRPPKLPSEVLKEAIRLLPAYSRQLAEHGRDYVLCDPRVRQALGELFVAVQEGAAAAYANGAKRGRSLLVQLADDELTLSEFNDRVAKIEDPLDP